MSYVPNLLYVREEYEYSRLTTTSRQQCRRIGNKDSATTATAIPSVSKTDKTAENCTMLTCSHPAQRPL